MFDCKTVLTFANGFVVGPGTRPPSCDNEPDDPPVKKCCYENMCTENYSEYVHHLHDGILSTTVSFAYNDSRRGIRNVSFSAKFPYTRSLLLCITARWDLHFALGMEILSLFANCRYIRSRY